MNSYTTRINMGEEKKFRYQFGKNKIEKRIENAENKGQN